MKAAINVGSFIFITTVVFTLGIVPGLVAAGGIIGGYAWRVIDEIS